MTRRLASAPCLLTLALVVASTGSAAARDAVTSSVPAVVPACGVATGAETIARCKSQLVADEAGRIARFAAPQGYGPADLRDAYAITAQGLATTTVAVVVAYHDPTAYIDLKTYRATFGLPPCKLDDGCFTQVDQRGGHRYPPPDLGWSQEQSLDLDIASAMCPRCRLLVVEANTSSISDLAAAVDEAVALGAHAIVNAFGAVDSGQYGELDAHWNHPGIAIAASAGSTGAEFPASSEFVTAVGGTTLARAGNPRGWRELALGPGACSGFTKPAWQTDTLCAGRTLNDVAADGDPSTGVAVYGPDGRGTSSWLVFGGTSVSAALIAGVYGVDGRPATYGSDPYARPSGLHDLRRGGCGSGLCGVGSGYDAPSGMGSPKGAKAFGALR